MMQTSNKQTLLEPFQYVQNKSEIPTRNVGKFCWKQKKYIFFRSNFYIYYLAGYPVSGKIIGRIDQAK